MAFASLLFDKHVATHCACRFRQPLLTRLDAAVSWEMQCQTYTTPCCLFTAKLAKHHSDLSMIALLPGEHFNAASPLMNNSRHNKIREVQACTMSIVAEATGSEMLPSEGQAATMVILLFHQNSTGATESEKKYRPGQCQGWLR